MQPFGNAWPGKDISAAQFEWLVRSATDLAGRR
jgi:hypothetical protein